MDPMAAEGLTDGMTHLKREKSRNSTTDAILNALDKKKYDGQQKQYRRWFKAVVEQLEEVGFYNIERDIKLENLEEIDEETWVQYYSVPDRRYIYTAVKATLSQAANDAADGATEHRNHYAPRSRSEPAVAGAYLDRVFPSHTVSGTAAPVEGGGGDGLDEVDKFIHDALNQAPPTEGGASPIEGGGEPDLGALGIHGHSEQMVNDRVYKRITRITGDHTYEAYNRTDGANQRLARGSNPDTPFAESIDRLNNYDSIFANPPFPSVTELQLHIRDCEAVFDANKTLSITLVIPDWESVTVDRWEYLFSIPAGEEVYRHPNGKSCGKTRWAVAVYRLCRSSHDGLTPAVIRRNTRLEDIRVKDVFLWQEGDFINSVAEIHTANKGTTFVYLIGLLEYHPEVWDQVLQHAKPEQNMFRKVELHAWPGWDGLIVGYDTNTQVYEIAFSNGEFDDAKKNEFDVKGSAALMTAQTADTNPILTSENRKNIFVPTNSRELMAMKPGPLKSRRVIFEIKFDPITGLLLKAKARLVAQGFTQIFGVDFFETYASTPKVSTMRMFMFIVVTYEMKMDEFDVRAAYLHSYLTETIYMKPPHGLERYDENGNELIWLTRLFFTREHARAGVFKLLHTPGDDNPSDALTKPLSFQRIQHLMQVLKSWGYRVLNFIRTSAQASADEPSAKRMKQTTAHADGDAF
ncbi:reverse transcriptase [Pseudoscourfieldia marina]